MTRLTVVFCVCCLFSVIPVRAMAGSNEDSLKAITETANNICGTLAAAGSAESSNIEGAVKADMAALSSKIAAIHGDIKGAKKSQTYEGLPREDLAVAYKSQMGCKQFIFDKLVQVYFPNIEHQPPMPPPADETGDIQVVGKKAAIKFVEARNDQGVARVAGFLSFQIKNEGKQPIQVAILSKRDKQDINLQYDDGTKLSYMNSDCSVSGISICSGTYDSEEKCKNMMKTQIPQQSSINVTVSMADNLSGANLDSLDRIETVTFDTVLFVTEGTASNLISKSIQFPVKNFIKK